MSSLLKKPLQITIAQGVNLDLLSQRPKEHYASESLESIQQHLKQFTEKLNLTLPIELNFFQSNNEGDYLQHISKSWDGALLNPGAWTHYSIALADRLEALRLVFVEVHISKPICRESYRHHSLIAPHAIGVIQGLGKHSYSCGLLGLLQHLGTLE